MDFVDAYLVEGDWAFEPGFREGLLVQQVLEAVRRAALKALVPLDRASRSR